MPAPVPGLTALIQRVDPASDAGWDTEVFAQGAQDQLDRLAAMLRSPATFSSEHVAEFSVAKVSCFPLRPHDLEEVFTDGSITVLRRPRTEADHHRREEAGFSERGRHAAIPRGATERVKLPALRQVRGPRIGLGWFVISIKES